MPAGNPFAQKLRKNLFPAIDDPRETLTRKMRNDVFGELATIPGVRLPQTKRPKGGRIKGRAGRPSRPSAR